MAPTGAAAIALVKHCALTAPSKSPQSNRERRTTPAREFSYTSMPRRIQATADPSRCCPAFLNFTMAALAVQSARCSCAGGREGAGMARVAVLPRALPRLHSSGAGLSRQVQASHAHASVFDVVRRGGSAPRRTPITRASAGGELHSRTDSKSRLQEKHGMWQTMPRTCAMVQCIILIALCGVCVRADRPSALSEESAGGWGSTLLLGALFGAWYLFNIYFNM